MFTSHKVFLSILSGAVVVGIVTFGMVALTSPAVPAMAQTALTTTPTGPAVNSTASTTVSATPSASGSENEALAQGLGRESSFFINDLAQKLNVPASTLQSAIQSALSDTNAQAVKDNNLSQSDANVLATQEANLFNSTSGVSLFDLDHSMEAGIPVTGATAVAGTPVPPSSPVLFTSTPGPRPTDNDNNEESNESKEQKKDEQHPTPKPSSGNDSGKSLIPSEALPVAWVNPGFAALP